MAYKNLKKIYLGEREGYYSIFLEHEEGLDELLFPKDLGKLESYVCGLLDGSLVGDWDNIPIENGCPKKDYVDSMKEEDFKRVKKYVIEIDSSRFAHSIAPD